MTTTTWATPQYFFDILDQEFCFTLDVAALPGTAKCTRFFSPDDNGLVQDWTKDIFFCNPPYGRVQNVYQWVKKAHDTADSGGTGVCLLPASVDTRWFHDFCMRASEIRFVKDRLWFSLEGIAQRSNHASMVVVFRPVPGGPPRITSISNSRKK